MIIEWQDLEIIQQLQNSPRNLKLLRESAPRALI